MRPPVVFLFYYIGRAIKCQENYTTRAELSRLAPLFKRKKTATAAIAATADITPMPKTPITYRSYSHLRDDQTPFYTVYRLAFISNLFPILPLKYKKSPSRRERLFKISLYFFIASTCLATSSLKSSLFFSRPSPITKKQNDFS